MKRFACGDVVPGCDATFVGETDEDVLNQVGDHARDAHGMNEVPGALVSQVSAAIRAA